MDVYLSTVSNRLNAVMKQLTIIATIFLPLSWLTGFFGQNFGFEVPVAVDGVSLTLVDVERERFSVALIPHTLEHTTLGFKEVGAPVNLESDLLAKYVWKCLQLRRDDS